MAVNKVELRGGTTLIDLTSDTVTAADAVAGVTLHLASGERVTGTLSDFDGATASMAGAHGLVPAPAAGDQDKVLRGNGAWSALLDLVYPVGALYLSTSSTSPATLFGGTWTRIQDTFLLAAGTTYAAGATGGEATHTLTESEMPTHTHGIEGNATNVIAWVGSGNGNYGLSSGSTVRGRQILNAGSGQAHNNMPPYLAVYVWERTA